MASIKTLLKPNFIFLFLFVIGSTQMPTDPDFGWHYKYGEYLYTNHRILKENTFSYTLPEYEWSNSYWLSQLVFFITYTRPGSLPANLIFNLFFGLVVYFFILRKVDLKYQPFVWLLLFVCNKMYLISVRPLLFSSLFVLIQTEILLNRKNMIKYLPLLYLLWANLHPDFVVGLMLLGLYLFFELVKSYREAGMPKPKTLLFLSAPWLWCFLATFVNPYTYKLWLTLLNEMNHTSFRTITEMMPMYLDKDQNIFISSQTVVGALLAIIYFQRRKLPPWYILSCILMFIIGARAVYFWRVYFLLTIFVIAQRPNSLAVTGLFKKDYVRRGLFIYLPLFTLIAALMLADQYANLYSPKTWKRYPIDAVSYLKETYPTGRMFNSYAWGGYLIWQLPEHQTFIDGRMASWRKMDGVFFLEDYGKIYSNPEENEHLIKYYFDQYEIGFALVEKQAKITDYLENSLSWRVEYDDGYAVVLLKQ